MELYLIILIFLLILIVVFIMRKCRIKPQIFGGDEKYYYHGSNKKLEKLVPKSSNVLNGENAVFATNNKCISAIFSARWNDNDLEFGYHDDKLYIQENREKAFDI